MANTQPIAITMQKNELLIPIDDESKESRFIIRAMMLRGDWDRSQSAAEQSAALVAQHMQLAGGEEQP